MSVNIGTEAVNAIVEMRGNPQFDRMISALGVFAQQRLLTAMDTTPEMRTDATAHARGIYHLWQAMHSAYAGLHISQSKLPAPDNGRRLSAKAMADV